MLKHISEANAVSGADMCVVYQFNLRIINSVYRRRVMKVMVLQIPQDEDEVVMNQFTVLSEHANGYSYELGNFSVPLEREELNKHMDNILRQFKLAHGKLASQHINKDNQAFKRVIDVALKGEDNVRQKEFYERLFLNTHKAKSLIQRLVVTHTELLLVKEGQLLS